MTPTQTMLEEIRGLAFSGGAVSRETRDFLARGKSLYLLSRTGEPLWKAAAARQEIEARDRYERCAGVFTRLAQTGIAYAHIKGAPLAQAAYQSAGLRFSSDIDLLVCREDLPRLKALLGQEGFLQARLTADGAVPYTRSEIVFYGMATHQTAPFLKAAGSKWNPYLSIDLNTGIFWGESGEQTDMASLLRRTACREVFPGVSVSLLEAPDAFVSLCLHHYKDMNSLFLLWERDGYDFSQFCDVYFFFDRQLRDCPPGKLRQAAGELRAVPYLYWMLYHTARIFPDRALAALAREMETGEGRALLDSFGLSEAERRPWALPFEERLFHPSLRAYLEGVLSPRELEKIQANRQYL